MKQFLSRLVNGAIAVAVVLAFASVAEACPSCKAALGSGGDDGQGIVNGFFWSILFMMSMPFLLLGAFSAYFYVLVRRGQQTPAPAAEMHEPGRAGELVEA